MTNHLEELREKVCKANLDLVKYDLVTLTWGNVSGIDRDQGLVAIKPSGVNYDDLEPKHIVVVDLDGNIVDGDLRRHSNNLFKKKIMEVATKNPNWISENATALFAINKMTSLKISSLLVARNKDIKKKNKRVVGVLTMLNCLISGIK